MDCKFKVIKEFEISGFMVDKDKAKVTYETIKARTRKSCNNSDCKKYGFVNDVSNNPPTPNYPRIEAGDICFKITYSSLYSDNVWCSSNKGFYCCEECLKSGFKKLRQRLLEREKSTSKFKTDIGKDNLILLKEHSDKLKQEPDTFFILSPEDINKINEVKNGTNC